jgi:hypothetical protein
MNVLFVFHQRFMKCFTIAFYEFNDSSSEVEINMHVKLGAYLVSSPPIVL